MAEASFRIRLTGKHPTSKANDKQQRHVVTVTPSMTLHDLTKSSYGLFGVPVPSNSSKNKTKNPKRKRKRYDVQFWIGFPPKQLCDNNFGGEVKDDSLVRKWIQSGDNVICRFEEFDVTNAQTDSNDAIDNGQSAKATDQGGRTTQEVNGDDKTSIDIKTRPKRASAMAATASFAENIRAQEKLLRNEKEKKSRNPRKASHSAVNKSISSHTQAAKRKAASDARAAATDFIVIIKCSSSFVVSNNCNLRFSIPFI